MTKPEIVKYVEAGSGEVWFGALLETVTLGKATMNIYRIYAEKDGLYRKSSWLRVEYRLDKRFARFHARDEAQVREFLWRWNLPLAATETISKHFGEKK